MALPSFREGSFFEVGLRETKGKLLIVETSRFETPIFHWVMGAVVSSFWMPRLSTCHVRSVGNQKVVETDKLRSRIIFEISP